jgi:hypothetical protein
VIEYRINPASAILLLGPAIEIEIGAIRKRALLDTGASFSHIDIDLARDLGLAEGGTHEVLGVTGRGTYPTFIVDLYIPELDLTVPGPVPGLPLKQNYQRFEAIVGRDVICRYEFTINSETGLVRFTEL